MSNPTLQVKDVKFILYVQDMNRAIKFYQDVFGLEIKSSSPHWSELIFGTAIVALHSGGTGEFHATGLSFTVNNIEIAVQKISRAGGAIRSGPKDQGSEGIILADVTDCEGNGFMISQNK